MAINVKRLKRVIQGDEPLKVLNSGDKKPAFRQNGYGLTLDAANSDYLIVEDAQTWLIFNDIDLSITLSVDVIIDGVPFFSRYNDNSNRIEFGWATSGLFVRISSGGINLASENISVDTYNISEGVSIKFKNSKLYLDDVEVRDYSISSSETLSAGSEPVYINRRAATVLYQNSVVKYFSINTETFNFSESRGTTTTGSLGTTATINTSNAGGVQYLDSTVWNKKPFALELVAANSEYLEYSSFAINNGDVVRFEGSANDDLSAAFRYLLGGVDGSYLGITNGSFRIQAQTGGASVGYTTPQEGEAFTFEITRVSGEYFGSLNGEAPKSFGLLSGEDVNLDFVGRRSGSYSSVTLYNLQINTEQFTLTEGLGNEVYGSNGTIGTINTDALGGIVGSDSNELVFDSANSDYLDVNDSLNWVNLHDIKFEIEGNWVSNSSQVILSKGDNSVNGVTGYFRVRNNGGVNGSFIQYSDIDGLNSQSYVIGTIDGDFTLKMDVGVVTLDGVVVLTLSDQAINISPTYNNLNIGRFVANTLWNIDGVIKSLSINNETFNLIEGKGTAITGSLGTTATINTSHADGSEYVDYKIWGNPIMTPAYRNNYGQWLKNGNILKLDSANLDYLELGSVATLQNEGDSVECTINRLNRNNDVFFFGNSSSLSNFLTVFSSGGTQLRDSLGNNYNGSPNLDIIGEYKATVRVEGGNYVVTINGVEVINSLALAPITFNQINRRAVSSAYISDIEVKNFTINNEQFQFREGQGITTKGSLGTTATINTANAGGVQYINEQVWNIDSNKYIDYE